jgi:type II secretory pathway pseudopilin PulG
MVVLAILLVLATLIIPNILRSHINSNEITTISNLTSLGKAIQEYYLHNSYSYPENLTDLTLPNSNPPYISQELASGSYTGYSYAYASSQQDVGFSINAEPITPGKTGVRHFYLDETGVIRTNSERKADENDTPIQ